LFFEHLGQPETTIDTRKARIGCLLSKDSLSQEEEKELCTLIEQFNSRVIVLNKESL